jgi:hypothetical protein
MTTFADVKIGETFRANGITAVKQSSRTGKVLSGLPGAEAHWFYWGQKESVVIVKADKE